jgi:ABC-2 type transport system ATP-binding protein
VPTSTGPVEVIEVEDLVVRYGDLVAVDGVSFTARAGEVTVVLGPNGAGKTSTVEHLEGYRPAAAGRARVLGLDPQRDHHQLVRRVGVMLQEGGIQPAIRPREVLRQYAGFFPDPLDVDELLDSVGLTERAGTTVRRLSGGERQRLSLALALIGRPEVVVLDEPTAGIDLEGRERIRSILEGLRTSGTGVLVTTHDLDEAERFADHVVVIDRGRVVAAGSLADLTSERSTTLGFRSHDPVDVETLGRAMAADARSTGNGAYEVDLPAEPQHIARLSTWLAEQGVAATEIRAGGSRLEDVYRDLVTGAERRDEA